MTGTAKVWAVLTIAALMFAPLIAVNAVLTYTLTIPTDNNQYTILPSGSWNMNVTFNATTSADSALLFYFGNTTISYTNGVPLPVYDVSIGLSSNTNNTLWSGNGSNMTPDNTGYDLADGQVYNIDWNTTTGEFIVDDGDTPRTYTAAEGYTPRLFTVSGEVTDDTVITINPEYSITQSTTTMLFSVFPTLITIAVIGMVIKMVDRVGRRK